MRLGEEGFLQMRLEEVGSFQMRLDEQGSFQMRLGEARFPQIGQAPLTLLSFAALVLAPPDYGQDRGNVGWWAARLRDSTVLASPARTLSDKCG